MVEVLDEEGRIVLHLFNKVKLQIVKVLAGFLLVLNMGQSLLEHGGFVIDLENNTFLHVGFGMLGHHLDFELNVEQGLLGTDQVLFNKGKEDLVKVITEVVRLVRWHRCWGTLGGFSWGS